jgi:hypothetical protein
MPEYTFQCEKCDSVFAIHCSINDYDNVVQSLKCTECKSKKVHREYVSDNIHGHVNEVKTLGQLAEKNMKKYGSELVTKMRQEHQTKREEGMKQLPSGMKRIRKAEDFTNNYSREDWKRKGK